LGYYIFLNGSTLLNYPAMYAGIVAMSVMGMLLYFGIDGLDRLLCPWNRRSR
jgi:NitT/TauT family transport system permease protein